MAWVRIDEHFSEHPKLAALGAMLPAAGWLHVSALCYCNRHLTDGRFPTQLVAAWWPWHGYALDGLAIGPYDLALALVTAGVWEDDEAGGCYVIHDYLDFQPSRTDVLKTRRAKARAGRQGGIKAQARRKQTPSSEPSNSETGAEQEAKQTPSSGEADVKQPDKQTASRAEAEFNPDPDPVEDPPGSPPEGAFPPDDDPRPGPPIRMRPAVLRKRAEAIRAKVWCGRCHHDPPCASVRSLHRGDRAPPGHASREGLGMTIRLRVLMSTPSLNDWLNVRQRWRYREIRRRWLRALRDAVLEERAAMGRKVLPWPRPPKARVQVHVVRYAPRAYDDDNFRGGLKPVLDGLKALELIDDDGPTNIDVAAEQTRSPYRVPNTWTEITLTLADIGAREDVA